VISWDLMSWDFMWFHGISWDVIGFHGISCDFMGFHVVSCGFMWFHGISWDFMGFHVVSCDFMGFHGISCDFMGFHMIYDASFMLPFTSRSLDSFSARKSSPCLPRCRSEGIWVALEISRILRIVWEYQWYIYI
jgi:hypothetical protein